MLRFFLYLKRGVLKIAEVVSRIENKEKFIRAVESIGFKLVSKNNNNVSAKMNFTSGFCIKNFNLSIFFFQNDAQQKKEKDYFYYFDFVKMTSELKKRPEIKLLPCLYKKR